MNQNRPPTEAELAEIEARCSRAPAGPWLCCITERKQFEVFKHAHAGIAINKAHYPRDGGREADQDDYFLDEKQANIGSETIAQAKFIAHARTDVPRILAEVRRLRALLAQRGLATDSPE
jgi:hypothetical protein